jgi:hypothetical protein
VLTLALLFAAFGSGWSPVTVAVSTLVPGVFSVATTVIVALPALARLPIAHMTGPVPVQVPVLGVAEVSVAPTGRTSVTVTPVASVGPLLVATI